ncbi:MAG: DUF362 domain-containing protein [Dehalococcoidia bacterium]|nr:DUF362 domain-containing protein [Dehalococcoidia bacterium]
MGVGKRARSQVDREEGDVILDARDFVFELPPRVRWARRILIKPCAGYPIPYPATTSREILERVISSIRAVSEADIILLEGSPCEEEMKPIYKSLGYEFPRVIALDVRDTVLVEVENPLVRPFAVPTFWVPNVILYCDYLISITPCKIVGRQGDFTIRNLLGLLPVSKYQGSNGTAWGALHELGMDKVLADLYFTLPFDLGVIDARKKFIGKNTPSVGKIQPGGKVFVGEPYEVDREASQWMGVSTEYLQWIEIARTQVGSEEDDS